MNDDALSTEDLQWLSDFQEQLVAASEQEDIAPKAKADNLCLLARVRTLQRSADQSIALYQQALSLYRDSQDIYGESHALCELGWLIAQQGNLSDGISILRRSLSLFEQMRISNGDKAKLLLRLGDLLSTQHDCDVSETIACLKGALEIYLQERSPHADMAKKKLNEVRNRFASRGYYR